MKTTVVWITLFCTFGQILGEVARYDNYRLYSVSTNSIKDISILNDLEANSDSVIFLSKPSKESGESQVVVALHKLADFVDLLQRHGLRFRILEKNLQRQIDLERKIMKRSNHKSDEFDFDKYHTLEELHNWLHSLEKNYPDVVKVVSAGKSFEGRDLLGVELSHGENKPGVFVESGIHAREWITPATTVFLVNELLTSTDPDVRYLAENFTWYILPSVNPDGYVHTHEKNRLWRKTRKPHGTCVGVDANRNWDFHWNEVGASNQPCSDTYAGPEAFSEPETVAVSNYVKELKDKVHLYLSFHSFSQLIIFPNGYTSQHVVNHKDLQDVGDVAAKALSQRYGTKYTVGPIYETIYPAAGTSIDWSYGAMNVSLSFCYELRPKTLFQGGFQLPANQIRPTALETLDSLVAMVKRSEELNYFETV
uniref:Carboxypeptidase A-like protein n=1 Tax=Phlebotomus papatasi TaxID=29031 RepID=A8CAE9_PHLPP|nr:carboxypeptidase A-like protein [Phlebotomus papatasi]